MYKKCEHCGTPFKVSASLKDYCCHGCEEVSRLIREEGLEHFYDLQDQLGRPLKERPFLEKETAWAVEIQKKAEADEDNPSLVLRIEGMTCMGCVWLIERVVRKTEGVLGTKVSLTSGSLSIQWRRGSFDLAALSSRLQRYGYRLESGLLMGYSFSDLARRSFLSGIFTINILFLELPVVLLGKDFPLQVIFQLLALLFAGLSWAIAAGAFVPSVLRALRARVFSQDILLFFGSCAAICWYFIQKIQGAGGLNELWIGSLAFIIVFGRWVQILALDYLKETDDARPASESSKTRTWILYWVICVTGVLVLSSPFLFVRGVGALSLLSILAAGLLVTPVNIFYELSRLRDGGFAVLAGVFVSAIGLVAVTYGLLGPLGAAIFSMVNGLLTVAVLGIRRKLRSS